MTDVRILAAGLALGLISLAGLASCGPPTTCTDVGKSPLNMSFEDESGETVSPDKIVVKHDGDQQTRNPTCSNPGTPPFVGSSGTFDIEATCGDETVTRTVEVSSDSCDHPVTEDVTLTFPEGACDVCNGADAGTDAGNGDAGMQSDSS